MNSEEQSGGKAETSAEDQSLGSTVAPQSTKEQSRFDRLKSKIKKLQGKNPDIYPMF